MRSFKGKLVAHFVLLSLLPLVAATLGFARAERANATQKADRSLEVGLRAATAAYRELVGTAQARADAAARSPQLVAAVDSGDRAATTRLIGGRDLTASGRGIQVGKVPERAATRKAVIVEGGRRVGSVTAFVEVDDDLAERLLVRSGLSRTGKLAVALEGRIVAGIGRGDTVPPAAPDAFRVEVGATEYRGLAAAVGVPTGASIIALVPAAPIDAAAATSVRRLVLALVASLLFIGLIAYFEARSIVRAVGHLARVARAIAGGRLGSRVPVEGRDEIASFAEAFNEMAGQLERRIDDLHASEERLRTSISRFGDALAATHDPHQLAETVLAAGVDATGAAGGAFLVDGRSVATVGDLDSDEQLEFPVRAGDRLFGTLVLCGVGSDSTNGAELATSLARQAGIAFENARLHRVLERQARVDELTGFANRRSGRELLQREVQRATRLGTPLAVAVCDLDGFKRINDEHDHAAGDAVLRAFADLVRSRIRAIDIACRWGGEEFVFVLPDTDAAGAHGLAETLRSRLAAETVLVHEGTQVRVTASFGVAAFEPGLSAEELVARADRALYSAKRSGKNLVALAGAEV